MDKIKINKVDGWWVVTLPSGNNMPWKTFDLAVAYARSYIYICRPKK